MKDQVVTIFNLREKEPVLTARFFALALFKEMTRAPIVDSPVFHPRRAAQPAFCSPRGGREAGGKSELPSDHQPPDPAPGFSSLTGKPARYPVTLFTSLVCCTITEPENACFWHALAPNCADSN
jgi:hypothetical protein